MTGAVPVELGNLRNLETLSLQNNELTGPLPLSLAGLGTARRVQLLQHGIVRPGRRISPCVAGIPSRCTGARAYTVQAAHPGCRRLGCGEGGGPGRARGEENLTFQAGRRIPAGRGRGPSARCSMLGNCPIRRFYAILYPAAAGQRAGQSPGKTLDNFGETNFRIWSRRRAGSNRLSRRRRWRRG